MVLSNQLDKFCHLALAVIETEAQAIQNLTHCINENFAKTCEYLLNCQGRIVVMGMGKSGHIASKIAATLASTGSPAFFVHPAEACHGDMGMITAKDTIIALSNSGETPEILTILPLIKRLGIPLITLTGKSQSTLAETATVNIDVSVAQEACPMDLAPTASSTAALVMGDAIAIALLQARGFTPEDFALSHPGGSLGRRLLLRTEDLMHTGSAIPIVSPQTKLTDALLEMTQKSLGITAIVNNDNSLLGIYTDGDLRRTLDNGHDFANTHIESVMTKSCKTISPKTLAVDALELMEKHKITSLLVTDAQNKLMGVIHLHDLLRAGV